ncbi:DEAD-box ATP-dependent RNA helicase [Raphidocelis subcapitata]|uniref:ATP-dependent RNA helicase n=1 Tax=Raphidocelis subcapitata TaxID=307507 RepID=A0A2V0P5E6_9CHLO|nr:DEAD-box ATP-dependent RNA helicase [Raphidocelis subcapitata]|eukprot:GBF93083.1 DEAD-box ATP-dependent RNA helicase [Raphidocelis subcapitata]
MATGQAPPVVGQPFSALKCISKATLAVLEAQGFTSATPVQETTIPLLCGNKDVAVDAATGSGKTLAFVVPVVEKLRRIGDPLKRHQVGAVIVSPTRELARQIHSVAAPFVASLPGMSCLLLVGGTDPAADVAQFRQTGGHVLVGTPGRLDDMMKRCPEMDARRLEVLVLDEADRLLDMGFKAQLDAIMARLPKQRRTGLFSATQTEAVEALTRAGLRNPVRVAVAVSAAAPAPKKGKNAGAAGEAAPGDGSQVTPVTLQLQYLVCDLEEKMGQLIAFMSAHREAKAIVYFLTCACVEHAALALRRHPALRGAHVSALHGRLKQAQREATLSAFAAQPAGVLLCTDLAARGLDIPDVGWVVQYDPPQDPAAFVHRVGRTARMGRSGAALALLLPSETAYVELLRLRRVPLAETEKLPGAPPDLSAWLRREAETDREAMEKATRAFVSFVRGYKEHHLKYIFRVQDLSLGRLAASMGLLRLPRMQETKKTPPGDFEPSPVDPESVPFRDRTREKQRRRQLKQRAEAEAASGAADAAAAKRDKAAAAAARKRPGEGGAGGAGGEEKLPAAKRRQLQQRDELEELTRDYALLKKLKKGKISERAFEVAAGFSSGDESEFGGEEGPSGSGDERGGGDGGGGAAGAEGDAGKRRREGAAAVAATAAAAAEGSRVSQLLAKKAKRQKKKQKKRRAVGGGGGAAGAAG